MSKKDSDIVYELDTMYGGSYPFALDEKLSSNIGSYLAIPSNSNIGEPYTIKNEKSGIEVIFENTDGIEERKVIEIEIGDSNNVHEWLFGQIKEFEELRPNWDGYGGIPALEEIAEHTRNLIRMLDANYLDKISDIFSNSHGTITIEWENDSGERLSLEIGKNNYSYFVRYNNRDPKPVDGQNILSDIKMLTEDISELFSETTTF